MDFNSNNFEEYKDMFNNYNLITKVNPCYKLYFNKAKKCFCVINSAKNNQICLNFNSFSINLIKLLAETRIENSHNLFNYIEEFNENLTQKNINKSLLLAKDKTEDYRNYLTKKSTLLRK